MSKREQTIEVISGFPTLLALVLCVALIPASWIGIAEATSSGQYVPETRHCRMADVNHIRFDDDTYRVQVIFWGWRKSEWHVMDYLEVDPQFREIPKSPWIISVDGKVYKIYYDITSESWTEYDPEMRDRFKLLPDDRDLFFKAGSTRRYSKKVSVLRAEA